jgi:hypothetical protein
MKTSDSSSPFPRRARPEPTSSPRTGPPARRALSAQEREAGIRLEMLVKRRKRVCEGCGHPGHAPGWTSGQHMTKDEFVAAGGREEGWVTPEIERKGSQDSLPHASSAAMNAGDCGLTVEGTVNPPPGSGSGKLRTPCARMHSAYLSCCALLVRGLIAASATRRLPHARWAFRNAGEFLSTRPTVGA